MAWAASLRGVPGTTIPAAAGFSVAGDDAGIVKAIIAMADSLNLGVIAEGVETREQLACLAKLGCREYQGDYFSRPVPAADFVRILQRDRPPAGAVRHATAHA